MNTSDHRETEDSVLTVYRKVSPSYRELSSEEDFKNNLCQRTAILNTLKLPKILFKGKKIIEVGGGTGENSLFYSLWGADVTIIEPNEISCIRAEELFSNFDQNINVINKSLFDIDQNIFNEFDIIIAEGVLHHTFDTLKAIDIILKNMRQDALVMIAIPEYHGWFKRQLQREVVNVKSTTEDEIILNAKKHFQSHIDRAVKYGLRSEDAVIYDTFVNPQIRREYLKDICDVFFENDIYHLSSYPSIEFSFDTQPWSKEKENKFNYNFFKEYYSVLEKIWMCSGEESFQEDIKNIDNLMTRVNHQYDLLFELKDKINNNSFKYNELNIIQEGYLGIGMNYFVGVKNSSL